MERASLTELIRRRAVVKRAAIMALIVGNVIAAINHGDRIWAGTMTELDWFKVALTFAVPYTVSTVSSILALRDQERAFARLTDGPGAPAE